MHLLRISLFFLTLLGLSAACLTLNDTIFAQDANASSSPEWEYKVADARSAAETVESANSDADEQLTQVLEKFLNDQGRGGWELVAYSGSVAIYKRATPN